MNPRILILIVTCLYSGIFSALAQAQAKQLSLLKKASGRQRKLDTTTVSREAVELLKAWTTKHFLYKNLMPQKTDPPPVATTIKADNGHIFLAIEIAFTKGEMVSRSEAVYKRLPDDKWSMIDLIYRNRLGHRLPLTRALILDTSGDQHLPVASVWGTGIYFVQPLGRIKATFCALRMTDIGFPDHLWIGDKTIFVLYKVPAEPRRFRLKIGDGESIAVTVKN